MKDIRDAFAKVKITKSFGVDNISSYYFLKLALPYIENSQAFLFNTSIETSQFPDSWKVARITPIFKEGDKTEKSNYRPISVLPVISKLFEKLVFNQLYHYMKENGLFTSDQSGFLRLHSTLTCLLKMSYDWCNCLDLGKLVGLVFIDLKMHFIRSTMIFSVTSSNFMAFSSESCLGLGLTYPTANNSVGLMVLIQILRK